ncbi:MAG: D-alanyl-D-alanine carboxypeptidase [Hyphomicrobium sp.]|nr:MAG: D-alanyl-D-alanine carboxypeptidase [Hyphomicrobium sp.]
MHVLLFATQGQAQNAEFTPKAKQAILMDAASGAVLYQFHADELVPPASMSKLMTLAVLFKSIKGGQLALSDEFLMSEQAWRRGGAPSGTSAMMVPVNTKARLDELIQGIIIQSGNDACIAVAEGMAGTEDAFARIMEAEARKLGLKKSTFRNATGLYHPEHLMTARELAILARHLITEYPDQYRIFSQKEFPYRKHKFVNRNPLLFLSSNVDGLKTGFIKESGYGLVASALQDGRRLIVVVGGLATAADRKDEAQKLLEWGFKSFTEFKLFDAAETVGQARVWGGERMYVPLVGQGDVAVILPRFPANQKLRAEIIYSGPLKAPLKRGDQVAKLRVTSSSSAVNEVPLFASEDVAVAGIMRRGIDSLVHMAFKWVPL